MQTQSFAATGKSTDLILHRMYFVTSGNMTSSENYCKNFAYQFYLLLEIKTLAKIYQRATVYHRQAARIRRFTVYAVLNIVSIGHRCPDLVLIILRNIGITHIFAKSR